MAHSTHRLSIPGPAGSLECVIDAPDASARGVAVVCHPHPQFGGTLDNKVVQTLVRAFLQLGYRTVRLNYRGVGASDGGWDGGPGEINDALAVVQAQRDAALPLVLAGFSFGAYVAAEVALSLASSAPAERLVLIGPSTEKQIMPVVPADTLVIHGEADEVVPLSATLEWAKKQSLPVIVLPGVGHFFHGQLVLLKDLVVRNWKP